MKYKSELIKEIVETRGHHLSSPHYESECVESWIEETKGAYPKLCDYESEWLNYIIENPLGVFPYETLVDITKATVYNVVPYAYKSAILKGQTLVNFNRPTSKDEYRIVDEERWQTLTVWSSDYNTWSVDDRVGYKPNTNYFAIVEVVENTLTNLFYGMAGSSSSTIFTGNVETLIFEPGETGVKRGMFTSRADFTKVTKGVRSSTETNGTVGTHIKFRIMVVEYQEGMEYWDIPYFEGMKSVQMPVLKITGKNLFNKNNIIVDGYIISNGNLVYETGDNRNATDFIEVEPNYTYSISGIKNSSINGGKTHQYVGMYDKNEKFISTTHIYCLSDRATFTTTENTKYIRMSVKNDDINRLQIEKGTTATTYEPHQSNIFTVNEEITLRSNGDVYDELNLLTGRLTQRIDENNEVLSQEVVKTVDLAVVNQDGDSLSKLIPFEGTMHLSTSSNTINPLFSGEIPVEAITQNLASFIEE